MEIEQIIVVIGTIMSGVMGLLIGSFLNVCIYRIPIKKSVAYGRSFCTSCKNTIKPYDLIPVFSYLILGGKCRFCKEKISIRYPSIEFLTGILYAVVFLRFGYTVQTIIMCALASILIVASMIDFDIMEIPNRLNILIVVLAIFSMVTQPLSIKEKIIGFFIVSVPTLLIAVLTKGGIGGGDIKLLASSGLLLGYKSVLVATFIGVMIGGIVGMIKLIKHKQRKQEMPLGPYLSIGIMIAALYGDFIFSYYISLFQ